MQRRTGDAEATAGSGGKATRSAMPLDRAIALIQWSWRRSRCVPQVAVVNEATGLLVGQSTNSAAAREQLRSPPVLSALRTGTAERARIEENSTRDSEGTSEGRGAPPTSQVSQSGRLRGSSGDDDPAFDGAPQTQEDGTSHHEDASSGEASCAGSPAASVGQAKADGLTEQECALLLGGSAVDGNAVSAGQHGRGGSTQELLWETAEWHATGDRSCGGSPQIEADKWRARRLAREASESRAAADQMAREVEANSEVEAKKGVDWESKLSASAAAFAPVGSFSEAWRQRSSCRKSAAECRPPATRSQGIAAPGVPAEGGAGERLITFLDICCGLGGFTLAALMMDGVDGNRWKGQGGVDYCGSLAKYWEQNFDHPFLCQDILVQEVQDALVACFAGITVGLLSAPCQPYCKTGRQKPGDARVDVLRAGVAIYLRIRPMCFVLENVDTFEKCAWEPVWEKELKSKILAAGYKIGIVRSNAKWGAVPMNRLRLWIVCTLYPRTGQLERRMAQLEAGSELTLATWYPNLKYVRFRPCHGARAVFDARKQAHPCFMTHCMEDVNLDSYKMRKGDPVHPRHATLLSLEQRKELCGLPQQFVLPPVKQRCRLAGCCKGKGRSRPLLGVSLGNIVVAPQALEILRNLELPPDAGTPVADAAGVAR